MQQRSLRDTTFILTLMALLPSGSTAADKATPQMVLVEPTMVTSRAIDEWKKHGFKGVAVVLKEDVPERDYRDTAQAILKAGLDLYWWAEVARNADLAAAHPKWMASLGSHDDWLKKFPDVPKPKADEVAKAYPWVPIGYSEAFDEHLRRIEGLLKRVPDGAKGLLLNDLQGGPSSCGCGNVLCRWAIDYHVKPTATKLEGDYTARFVAEVGKRAGKQPVIPVWTTECEEVDLPANKRQGRAGTGLCGTVPCATGGCPESFSKQWSALLSTHEGPVGLLALHTALHRTQAQFGGGPQWITNAIAYPSQTVVAHEGKTIPNDRLWVVVEESARETATKAGVGAVIVARTKIDQSYEPRIISTK